MRDATIFIFLGLRSRACTGSTGMLFFVLYCRIPPSSQPSISLTIPISPCILISTIVHTSPFPVWLLSGLPTLVAILINVLTRRLYSIAASSVMRFVESRGFTQVNSLSYHCYHLGISTTAYKELAKFRRK
jgi:hypothetical protein